MAKLFSIKILFSLFLIAWFAYGAWEARSYAFLARIFPFYVSLILLIAAVVSIIIEIRKIVKPAENMESGGGSADLSVDWDIPIAEVWQRFAFYLSLIIGLYGCIYIVGYPLAMSAFVFLFYRWVAGASWKASIIATAAALIFLAIASRVLGMDWPQGLIHLPWPLG